MGLTGQGIIFRSAIPKQAAADIARAVAFYEQRLGFSRTFVVEDYAGLMRGDVEIHLWRCPDKYIAENTACRINVEGVEALYKEDQPQGVIHPNGVLESKPWGMKEFTIRTLTETESHSASQRDRRIFSARRRGGRQPSSSEVLMRLIGPAVVLTFLMKEDIMRSLSGFLAPVFTADTALSAVPNLEQIDGVGRLRPVSMMPTNEEMMIASHTLACIRP